MPFLRVTRDKRGYENTFVVHSPKRRGRGRTRIIYWFRTPPGIRVGRAALDDETRQLIEQHHPEIRFDWTRILRGDDERGAPVPARGPAPAAASPATSDANGTSEANGSATAAQAELGRETVERLRARYSQISAAIARRVSDPERRDQLTAAAERLNPDAWVTPEQVRAAMERYESELQAIRAAIGGRRHGHRGDEARDHADAAPAPDSSGASDTAIPEPGNVGQE